MYSIDHVGLVTIVLACGGRWPSQLSGSLAKASTSSSSFSSARWVTSVMGHTGGYTRRLEVPRKQNHMSMFIVVPYVEASVSARKARVFHVCLCATCNSLPSASVLFVFVTRLQYEYLPSP